MSEYAFLVSPSHNRVYARAASWLARAELAVFASALGGRVSGAEERVIGGVPYVVFTGDALGERDLRLLSNVSGMYALFEVDGSLLRPVERRPLDVFPSDLLSILKYPGKTNEDFTRLLVNVTALATDAPLDMAERRLRVLDPMCGRGTTLNQALMYGWNTAGVDLDAKDFDAYGVFLRTWMTDNRIKHQAATTPIRRDKALAGRRFHATLGTSKEAYKAGDALELDMVNGDTLQAATFFKAGTFDLVVTDAPYGVQHGSRPQGGKPGQRAPLARRPVELLAAALPGWARLLRPGGAIGISWNTHVAKREEMTAVLEENGFEVTEDGGFRHRVDQSIDRDLVTARKPATARA